MKIFIGCSMNNQIDKQFKKTSEILLSKVLIKHDLVFGACNSGITGIAHDIACKNNRNITGVAPTIYKDNFKNSKCNKEIEVVDVANRMNEFIKESDVLLFLPGGYGTLAEFFFMVDKKRAGEFNKPIILYNDHESKYYDMLLKLLNQFKRFGFATEKEESYYQIMSDTREVIEFLDNYTMNKSENKM